jgi:cellulase/cellobiase CelA1
VVNSWPGGYQLQFTVTNNGAGTSTAWTAGFSFADSAESVASSWNATVTQSGTGVSAASASYNGAIAPGGTATWGMVVNGGNQALTGLACTLR